MVEKDVFLILAVIFLLLFWTLPWAIGSGAWINERLHLFVILLLLVVNAFSQNCETATSWLLDFALIGSLRLHLSKTCLCITMKCQNLPELWNHLTTSLATSTTCTSSPANFSPSDPWPNRSATALQSRISTSAARAPIPVVKLPEYPGTIMPMRILGD